MRICILSCALLVVTAFAADTPEGWLIPFAAAYQPDVAGFNSSFTKQGLPQARSRHYGWGIELRSLTRGLLIGPMFIRTWDDVENDSFKLRTDATGIFGEAGLKIRPAGFLTIVPMIGLGGLHQSFNLRAVSSDVPLDSISRGMTRTANLTPGMKLAGLAALELGLAANTSSGRFGVALRAGYMYSPLALHWGLANGAAVTGVPGIHLGGPFFTAGILLVPAAQVTTTTP